MSNGNALLPGIDGRSAWARRLKDLISSYADDLGGPSVISEAQLALIRRASAMTVELERMEARFSQQEQASERTLDLYTRTAGNLRRILETLGVERAPGVMRDVTPGKQPDPLAGLNEVERAQLLALVDRIRFFGVSTMTDDKLLEYSKLRGGAE